MILLMRRIALRMIFPGLNWLIEEWKQMDGSIKGYALIVVIGIETSYSLIFKKNNIFLVYSIVTILLYIYIWEFLKFIINNENLVSFVFSDQILLGGFCDKITKCFFLLFPYFYALLLLVIAINSNLLRGYDGRYT